jgi:hypothetical protein
MVLGWGIIGMAEVLGLKNFGSQHQNKFKRRNSGKKKSRIVGYLAVEVF